MYNEIGYVLAGRRLRDRETIERDRQVVQSGHVGPDGNAIFRGKPERKVRIFLQDLRGKLCRPQRTGRNEISQSVDPRQ